VHSADQIIESAVDLPFLHIVGPTARRILAPGCRMVGLLGSHYTMRGTYCVRRLEQRYGLTVLTIEGEHADNVQNALYRELAKGVFLPETRAKFAAAIADLVP
jgi:aspartate racemase